MNTNILIDPSTSLDAPEWLTAVLEEEQPEVTEPDADASEHRVLGFI